jgi:hypothetical protein
MGDVAPSIEPASTGITRLLDDRFSAVIANAGRAGA